MSGAGLQHESTGPMRVQETVDWHTILESYQGNQNLECQQVSSCQLHSKVQQAKCFQHEQGLSLYQVYHAIMLPSNHQTIVR